MSRTSVLSSVYRQLSLTIPSEARWRCYKISTEITHSNVDRTVGLLEMKDILEMSRIAKPRTLGTSYLKIIIEQSRLSKLLIWYYNVPLPSDAVTTVA